MSTENVSMGERIPAQEGEAMHSKTGRGWPNVVVGLAMLVVSSVPAMVGCGAKTRNPPGLFPMREGSVVYDVIGMSVPVPSEWEYVPKEWGVLLTTVPDKITEQVRLSIRVTEAPPGQPLEAVIGGILGQWVHSIARPRDVKFDSCRLGSNPCRSVTFAVDGVETGSISQQYKVIRVGDYHLQTNCEGWETTFARAVERCDGLLERLVVGGR